MQTSEAIQASDPSVVARYLQLRTVFHDRHLERIERLMTERYEVQVIRRIPPTLVTDVRTGFIPPGEGEIWPVIFLNAVDISVALCVQLSLEKVSNLGTTLNGPKRIRHRNWEDWWGWDANLASVHPRFFDLSVIQQEEAIVSWYHIGLEWLVSNDLLWKKTT